MSDALLYDVLEIANVFSTTPGPRSIDEGEYSGQAFRQDVLLPRILQAIEQHKGLIVDLDGTSGYGTSFLEEAFGGLIRVNHLKYDTIILVLKIKSVEEPYLESDVFQYLKEASEDYQS